MRLRELCPAPCLHACAIAESHLPRARSVRWGLQADSSTDVIWGGCWFSFQGMSFPKNSIHRHAAQLGLTVARAPQ